ncbi:hypothetical protein ABZ736_31965 [Streptomyces sp. NPDC013099]|uniref:hypothetical protein n=1 Tax=Streptomyces sp. NPDC013099 TaxID=3156687 RepID=UPI0033FD0D13
MTTTASGNDVALALIAQDIMFLRRFAHSVRAAPEQAVVPIFCMHNYMCMIIHESHRALRHVNPDLADVLAYDCTPAIERARHSVKLYDDKYKGLTDVSADFRRIIDEHQQEFLNKTWLPLARPLEKDLVLWRFRGRLVSTSHTASFFLALPPQSFQNLDVLGPEVRAIAVEQGSYIAAAANGLPWEGRSFLDTVQKTDLTEVEAALHRAPPRALQPPQARRAAWGRVPPTGPSTAEGDPQRADKHPDPSGSRRLQKHVDALSPRASRRGTIVPPRTVLRAPGRLLRRR